ncbi:MAG: plasmid pRiA4b ORF-3 family protein [Lachnospiraceae bacterium]|nr:plasmid pRiA4b ORF-3 family protein [Lachnospiraceae bacterium]
MKAYQFKITINGSKPPIWRRCIVPAGISFYKLAEVFNDVMGWTGYHLFEFAFDRYTTIITVNTSEYEDFNFDCDYLEAADTCIDDIIDTGDRFTYIYDMGDYWRHKVVVEKIIDDYEYDYPMVIKYKGDCPFEDCGGIDGYYDLLKILDDTTHPDYEMYKNWLEESVYNNYEYDIDTVNAEFECNFDAEDDFDFEAELKNIGSRESKDDIEVLGGIEAGSNEELFDFLDTIGVSHEGDGFEIFKNVVEKLKELDGSMDEETRLAKYCLDSADMLYGIVTTNILLKMYNSACSSVEGLEPIDILKLKELIKKVPKEFFNFEYIDNMYVTYDLIAEEEGEEDQYQYLLLLQGNIDYYIPSYEEMVDISTKGGLPNEPMLKRFKMFLANKMNVRTEIIDECARYIQTIICDYCEMDEILEFLEMNNIVPKNKNQEKELNAILDDLWQDSRMKIYRGFKPNELSSKKSDADSTGPDNIIDFSNIKNRKKDN